jgi:hypothetical protein
LEGNGILFKIWKSSEEAITIPKSKARFHNLLCTDSSMSDYTGSGNRQMDSSLALRTKRALMDARS